MSLFDGYAKQSYNVVSNTMGRDALWVPSDGSAPAGFAARVLFSNATTKDKLNDAEYNPYDWQIEFHGDDFSGLKNFVDSGATEVVTIDGTQYYVKVVLAKWDGNVSLAKLELKQ